jgi:hypothetical protein
LLGHPFFVFCCYKILFRKPWSFMPGMNKHVQEHPSFPLFVSCDRIALQYLDNQIAFRWVLWRRARGKNTTA